MVIICLLFSVVSYKNMLLLAKSKGICKQQSFFFFFPSQLTNEYLTQEPDLNVIYRSSHVKFVSRNRSKCSSDVANLISYTGAPSKSGFLLYTGFKRVVEHQPRVCTPFRTNSLHMEKVEKVVIGLLLKSRGNIFFS